MFWLQLAYCVCLTFGPLFVVFKSAELSEQHQPLLLCGKTALAYGATQLVKMLLQSMILLSGEGDSFDLTQEIIKAVSGAADIVGIYLALRKLTAGKPNPKKVLAVGLGWSFGESVLQRLAPIWFGAKGLEFDWSHVRIGIEANLSLILNISFVGIIWWVWMRRKDLSQSAYSSLVVGLLLYLFWPLLNSFLRVQVLTSASTILLVYALVALAVASLVCWSVGVSSVRESSKQS
mmetsp:Transcript_9863/g.16237  ORF Transcript_9863/g.16237 Transcript_9863/m.16237 type:complete len:234 (-) Transcript_9863:175-876(-)